MGIAFVSTNRRGPMDILANRGRCAEEKQRD
jgi:hypothetical protein